MADVEAFVTLQTNQVAAQGGGQRLGDFRLADAGLPFKQQRSLEFESKIRRRRETAIGDVELLFEKRL